MWLVRTGQPPIKLEPEGTAVTLGRKDVPKAFAKQISRQQCSVRRLADGRGCEVVAMGVNPTLIRWQSRAATMLYCKARTPSELLPEGAVERAELKGGDSIGLLGMLSAEHEELVLRVGDPMSVSDLPR